MWKKVVLVWILLIVGTIIFCRVRSLGPWNAQSLSHPEVEDQRTQAQAQKDFDALTQQIFVSEVSQDSITTNYQLADPAAYGVSVKEQSLGDPSLASQKADLSLSENWKSQLTTFDYDKLTQEQQLIYDTLMIILDQNLADADYLEYTEPLGITSGVQSQLPILMANYSFRNAEDVKNYLALLEMIPAYFDQIIALEQQKAADGLFMTDTTAQTIVDQCNDFAASPEDNYLLEVFNQKLGDYEKLQDDFSDSEIASMKKENRTTILKKVIPAYEKLAQSLTDLKGSRKDEGGLCNLKNGKDYFEWLAKQTTGSDWSVSEMKEHLLNAIETSQEEITKIMSEDPDAYYASQKETYPCIEPKETVQYLQAKIGTDFPALSDQIQCKVNYVDESLEDSLSPAFYLSSPIDQYQDNIIYINQNDKYDLSRSFTTIAHESYPGHLYQHAYFLSKNPAPIRCLIHVEGYTEGWGTYAELYGYDLADMEEGVATILKDNTLGSLALYGIADIGVNYEGWDFDRLYEYLQDFGFDASQVRSIYESMVGEPCSYLPYVIGYLEIDELKQEAQEALGDAFSIKAFHQYYLDMGPVPFLVLSDRLDDWIQEQRQG